MANELIGAEQERAAVVAWLEWQHEQNIKVDVGGLAQQSARRFALACRVVANEITKGSHHRDRRTTRKGQPMTDRDKIEQEAEAGPWMDIATAPTDGTEIIGMMRPKVIRLVWWFAPSSRTSGWLDENGKAVKPKWWMPLPAPPADLEREG